MMNSLNLISLLTLALVISLFVNLYYINSISSRKRSDEKSKKEFPSKLKKFLSRQSDRTRKSKSIESIPELHPWVVKLRGAYLLVESTAIDRGIDGREYWSFINVKLKSLVDLIIKFEVDSTLGSIGKKIKLIKSIMDKSSSEEDKRTIYSCLDRFYRSCEENKDVVTLKRYDGKLNAILKKLSDKNYILFERTVNSNLEFSGKVKGEIAKYKKSHSKVESAQESLREGGGEGVQDSLSSYSDGSGKLHGSLDRIQDSLTESRNALVSASAGLNHDASGGGDKTESLLKMLEISESLQESGEKEVAKLKGLVKNQRETIYDLEHELSLKGKTKEGTEGVSILSADLKGAEGCIDELESSLKVLKSDTSASRQSLNDESASEVYNVRGLEERIRELEMSATQSLSEMEFLRMVHSFTQEAVGLDSVEDLSMHVYVSLSDVGYEGQFIIFGVDREFVVSSTGGISAKVSVLLKSLSLNESSQSSNDKRLLARKQYLSCLITRSNGEAIETAMAVRLLDFLHVVDSLMRRVVAVGKAKSLIRSVGDHSNHIKKKACDIDGQLIQASAEISASVNASLKKIQDVARVGGLSATQISRIRTYEKEILDELSGGVAVNLKVKKAFLEILSNVEKMY